MIYDKFPTINQHRSGRDVLNHLIVTI